MSPATEDGKNDIKENLVQMVPTLLDSSSLNRVKKPTRP